VLAAPIGLQRFQLVPRWNSEIVQDGGLIQLVEVSLGDPEQVRGKRLPGRFRGPAVEHILGPFVMERSDHPGLPRLGPL
jgi:hypothetical protein